MKKIILLVFLFCLQAYCQKRPDRETLKESFENENFISAWHHQEGCCPHSITRSKKYAKKGKYSLRIELNDNDSLVFGNKRAEISDLHEPTSDMERWYKFSIYLPKGYQIDSVPEILAQWHEIADFNKGESYRSPSIALQIDKDKWRVEILWSAKEVNTNNDVDGREVIYLEPFQTGKWLTFVFHIKFSYKEDGLLEIWENGDVKLRRTGPNYYNDVSGPFFKFGLYKPWWNTKKKESVVKKRVLYFDDIVIMDHNASYNKITN